MQSLSTVVFNIRIDMKIYGFTFYTLKHVLTLKPKNFYKIEMHVKHTLILKVNYVCCVHITAFGLNAYQRILVLFKHKKKAYKKAFF